MLARLRNGLRSWRLWCWVAGVLATYTVAGFLAVPWVIERQLTALLQERLGVRMTVEDIQLNPWALTFGIDGLDLIDADGRRVISLERAFANLQVNSLTRKAWSIKELHLFGLHGSLRRYSATDSNIARLASRWSATAEPVTEPLPPSEPGAMPRLLIADLRVENASAALTDDVLSPPFFTSIDDLDVTVTNLSTLPDALAPETLSLVMGNGSQLHWTGSVSLNPLRSEGEMRLVGPYVDLAYSYLRSVLPVRLGGGWLEAEFQVDAALPVRGGFEAAINGFDASLSDLQISDRGNGTRLASVPLLAVEGGALQWAERSITLERLLFDGVDLRPERAADGTINFMRLLPGARQTASDPTGSAAAATSPAPAPSSIPTAPTPSAPWQMRANQLALQNWTIGLVDNVPAQPVAVEVSVEATLDDLSNVPQTPVTVAALVDLSSGGTLRAGGVLNVLPQIDFSGEMVLEGLALPVIQPYVAPFANISVDSGLFGGSGDLSAAPGSVRFVGSVALDDIALTDTVGRESLLGLSELAIESLTVAAEEQLQIDIGDIHIREPYARVEIEQNGENNIARTLIPRESATAASTQDSAQEVAAPELLPITVQNITIENGSADFSDESLPLPFAVHMAGLAGEVSALSTHSTEPARVNLEGQVDEYGLVTISGQLRPFAPAELTEIDLRFRNLDIPSMSPYIIKFAGRRIDDGDLDVDLSYRINDGQLSGDNALVMRDLVLGERVPHPDALDLPLGLAVALLKDRNGVIDLEVPVSGDINSPEFNYGQIIRRALANVISSIVTSPFRLLARLVGSGDEELGAINFMPGRADVAPPERETLASLAGALQQRPQLLLKINGVAAEAEDTQALREQFLERRIEESLVAGAAVPAAGAAPADNADVAAPTRTSVLEGFYMTAQQGVDVDATAFLQQLRVQHTRPATAGEPEQFDELAYASALRREMLPLEPVSAQDLEVLGQARAAAVLEQLKAVDPTLIGRAQLTGVVVAGAMEEGWIGMELEVDVSQ
ncbi:MAG: DUF748 domain-containing protein [Gammaproteobacteria bacterium]|nr:DUF748 domain-containing protein [Gammaproteobacteria bacterium]